MPPERILGLPVYTSSQIRTDLGGGTDESRMMLVGDTKTIMLADGGQTEITILKELFARQFKIGVLASKEIDFGIRREEDIQFLTGLTTT
jgi:HK97 family phage major capsid protein